MSDYCVVCGKKQNNLGHYLEFETVRHDINTLYTEEWICKQCFHDNRLEQ